MNTYLNRIFTSSTIDDACNALQEALNAFRANGSFTSIPGDYENIQASGPEQVQDWFDEMKNDVRISEEGALKDIYDLFDATRSQLRKLGFHRNYD